MRKLVLVLGIAMIAMFTSCGKSTSKVSDSDSVKVDSTLSVDSVDSSNVDSVIIQPMTKKVL